MEGSLGRGDHARRFQHIGICYRIELLEPFKTVRGGLVHKVLARPNIRSPNNLKTGQAISMKGEMARPKGFEPLTS